MKGRKDIMRKIISYILILLFLSAVPVCGATDHPLITDEAGCLEESELEKLTKKIEKTERKYSFEAAIYTETDMSGYDAESTAEEIYRRKGYGTGESRDGILMYVCAGTGEYHLTVYGKGRDIFDSSGLAYIESKVLPYLLEKNCYGAFDTYIKASEELLEIAEDDGKHNTDRDSGRHFVALIAVALFILIVISLYILRKKKYRSETEDRGKDETKQR